MTRVGKAVVLVAAVVVIVGARPIVADQLDPGGFVEREQGLVLPESASDLQVVRYSSFFMKGLVSLDRTASAIFVIDRSDLDEFLGQHPLEHLPIPENYAIISALWQPGAPQVPWDARVPPEQMLRREAPPTTADSLYIQLYELDHPDRVAVWLTSDWN